MMLTKALEIGLEVAIVDERAEEGVPLEATVREHTHPRRIDEALQLRPVDVGDTPRGSAREPASEDGEPGERATILLAQQPPRHVDGRAQVAVSVRHGRVASSAASACAAATERSPQANAVAGSSSRV
jgi:hypothetical protein